jgi:CDGSH-type Zn-finger protein
VAGVVALCTARERRYIIGDLSATPHQEHAMSIVRMGMSENKKYSDGFDAIFAKKKAAAKPTAPAAKPAGKKKKAKKK